MGIMLGPSLTLAYLQELSFSWKSIEPRVVARYISDKSHKRFKTKGFEAYINGRDLSQIKLGN